MKKRIGFLCAIGYSAQVFAFPCYLTLAVDNCWTDYSVTVNVRDTSSGQMLGTVIVPQGQSWGREAFICQPGQTLAFDATFYPTFWRGDENKVYQGQRYWQLPQTIKGGETAWNIPLCFSAQFAEVPMPPQATNQCQCDTSVIPPIPPQQL